jgi:hypothetical protein
MSKTMGIVRICGTCDKEFYIGMAAIDSYIFKIDQTRGVSPKYYCKYSCYKPAAELKMDGRKKIKELSYETLY